MATLYGLRQLCVSFLFYLEIREENRFKISLILCSSILVLFTHSFAYFFSFILSLSILLKRALKIAFFATASLFPFSFGLSLSLSLFARLVYNVTSSGNA